MTPTLIRLGQALCLFFALHVAYWFVFKRSRDKSTLLSLVLQRIRVWSYLLVFLVSAWWLLEASRSRDARELQVLEALLLAASLSALLEAGAALIFEWLLPARSRVRLPYLLQSLARGVAYLMIFLALLRQLGADVSSILAGSAIFSVVMGLALQDTLGNLFAGLSIDLARPFRIGDWVRADDQEGRVEAINWRAITLCTRDGTRVSIPNNNIGKQVVSNYTWPSPVQVIGVDVRAHYRHTPARVERALLECVRDLPGAAPEPAPEVRVVRYVPDAVEYAVRFPISDYVARPRIEAEVRRRIWYRFRRDGIDIPFAIGDEAFARETEGLPSSADRVGLLRRVGFLEGLSEAERADLVTRSAVIEFTRGETIFRQGEAGDALYVVCSGQVEVRVADENEHVLFRALLGLGDFFGEISLMTGAPRSATVVATTDAELLEVDREDFRPLLERNPALAETISRALAERQQMNRDGLRAAQGAASAADTEEEIDTAARQILGAVRRFFSF